MGHQDLRMSYGNRIPGKGQGLAKKARIDLGLALLHSVALPGVSYTLQEIAAWCDCHHNAIQNIERTALKKVCNALQFRHPALRADLAAEFFERRAPAQKKKQCAS